MSDGAVTDRRLLGAATLVVLVATVGSLFSSEVWGLAPCPLCWYQRIMTFPLVVILGVAILEGRARVYRAALPLSIGGVIVGAYHSWLQATAGDACTIGSGCAKIQFRLQPLGLTLPNLGLLAMLGVTALLVALWWRQ
jgi:disulfide bond formation protein DsbB